MLGLKAILFNLLYPLGNTLDLCSMWEIIELRIPMMRSTVLVISYFRDLCVYLKISQYVCFFKFSYKYWKKKILFLQSAEFLFFIWKPMQKNQDV